MNQSEHLNIQVGKTGTTGIMEFIESIRVYRISTIGLSATLIAVSGAIFFKLDELSAGVWIQCLLLALLATAIVAALLLQLFNNQSDAIMMKFYFAIFWQSQVKDDEKEKELWKEKSVKAVESYNKKLKLIRHSTSIAFVTCVSGLFIYGACLLLGYLNQG